MATANKTKFADFYKGLENGYWENKPAIVVNPFKRNELKKFRIPAVMLVVLCFWYNDFAKYELAQAQQQLNHDTIKPEMLELAEQGKTSAILWMVENYPKTEQYRLDALLDQKNSDAMLLKSKLLYRTDKELSLEYLKAAALEGNPTAVEFLSEKNPNEIGWTKFFTEYVFK
ncbi:hypothetical protein FWP33_07400 [Vibrio parahaemolyticus]|nr:hypothetical protein [Vibrio parahaemolyticus]